MFARFGVPFVVFRSVNADRSSAYRGMASSVSEPSERATAEPVYASDSSDILDLDLDLDFRPFFLSLAGVSSKSINC